MENKDDGLLNWNSTKGCPYEYEISKYKDVISEDVKWAIEKEEISGKETGRLWSNIHLKTLATMDLKHVGLLSMIEGEQLTNYFDEKVIDYKKEITVWISYPFNTSVKIIIYPLFRFFDKNSKGIPLDYLGYVAWQIAQVYAEVYKNHSEEVGIWGHGFSDLVLEGFNIYENNVIVPAIGS